jgi:hypothetical protein
MVPVVDPKVTVTVTLPAFTPLNSPALLTAAMVASEVCQVDDEVTSFVLLSL